MGNYIFVAFCIIFFIIIIYNMSKARKKEKGEFEKNMNKRGAAYSISLPVLIGLSVPEDTMCNIYLCNDHYEFEANGITFSLKKEKITDISLKTNTEIQNQLVSSAGGAVAGAMLFGPLGAIIGGRIKEKESKKITDCLIFTYIKDDNTIDYIAFNSTGYFFKIAKIIGEFNADKIRNETENKKIDL